MALSSLTLLRGRPVRNSEDLGYVVALNEAVHRSSSDDRFSTLFCGVVSANRKHIRYVKHGQRAGFHCLRGRRHGTGGRKQLPIGIMEGRKYSEGTMAVKPGSLLVCVSDGICEAKNVNGDFWEEERIDDVLIAHRRPGRRADPRPLRGSWRQDSRACRVMQNKGQIYASDSDGRRLMPIYARLERAGARNVQVRPKRRGGDGLADLEQRCDLVSSMRLAPGPEHGGATPTPNGGCGRARWSNASRSGSSAG